METTSLWTYKACWKTYATASGESREVLPLLGNIYTGTNRVKPSCRSVPEYVVHMTPFIYKVPTGSRPRVATTKITSSDWCSICAESPASADVC
jgi:hypothetical protein